MLSSWWWNDDDESPVPAVGLPGVVVERDDAGDGSESNGFVRSWPLGPARGVRSFAADEGQNLSMIENASDDNRRRD